MKTLPVHVYNSETRSIQPIHAHDGNHVRMYSCGPTVYNTAHIGNLRSFIAADLLSRTIVMSGTAVKWVMNITDVDDKTIASTISAYGLDADVDRLRQFTQPYTDGFLKDLHHVGIQAEHIEFVNVSDVIPEIQKYIVRLIELGYAYKADDGSTYFSISTYQEQFHDYGALVGEKFLRGAVAGARVAVDEYEKDNLSDFALWKAQAENDGGIFWDHPMLGKGRPGWHIECTLINYMKFPSGTDVHTGGIDLLFPHHTNENAQAKPVYGETPFVGSWIHSEHILVEGRKMSKSLGNTYTLADLHSNQWGDGQSLRFLMLQSHYRSKLNVTEESLKAAQSGLQNIRSQAATLLNDADTSAEISPAAPIENEFTLGLQQHLNQDLDSPGAIALLFAMLKSPLSSSEKIATLRVFERALGLELMVRPSERQAEEIPQAIMALVELRDLARSSKDFAESDRIRSELEALGYLVSDTSSGTAIIRK